MVGAYGALGEPRQATAKATSWLGGLGLQRQWLAAAATITTCGYCGMGKNNGFFFGTGMVLMMMMLYMAWYKAQHGGGHGRGAMWGSSRAAGQQGPRWLSLAGADCSIQAVT